MYELPLKTIFYLKLWISAAKLLLFQQTHHENNIKCF